MIEKLIESFPQEIVEDAIRLHKHLAPGIILGFKMAMRALKELAPVEKDIITLTSETTRCVPDALQAVGRYVLQHGNFYLYFRTYDVGKLSIQATKNYKDQFRLVLNDDYLEKNKDFYAWVYLDKDQQRDLNEMRGVLWKININEAFDVVPFKKTIKPEFKGKQVIKCPVCGESTSRLSMIEHEGKITCKTCVFFDNK